MAELALIVQAAWGVVLELARQKIPRVELAHRAHGTELSLIEQRLVVTEFALAGRAAHGKGITVTANGKKPLPGQRPLCVISNGCTKSPRSQSSIGQAESMVSGIATGQEESLHS